ncbi:MAG: apolipoprotein N-acyltransferase [Deltaproteobacteria bacterium]|nr:apolipoprotein N-acyltransferase [Deltaproteobacteria bacterium]
MPSTLSGLVSAVVSGLLFAAALPFVLTGEGEPADPGGWLELLAFVALVPLLVEVAWSNLRRALALGLVAGCVMFGASVYWIDLAVMRFGGFGLAKALPLLLGVVVYCALYWAAALGAVRTLRQRLRWPLYLALPLAWTASELARNHLLTGNPWCSLGHTLSRTPSLVQIASLGGVYLVAALLALVNGAVAEALIAWRRRPGALSRGRVLLGLGLALGGITGAAIYSAAWRAHLEEAAQGAPRLKVALVQGNIDQRIRNREEERRAFVLKAYLPLTESLAREGAQLVIWPEAAWPGPFEEVDFQARPELRRLLRAGSAHYLLSGTTRHATERGPRRRNVAWLVGPDLSLLGTHEKSRLLPFGEYVPLEGLLPLRQVVPGLGSFVPGAPIQPLRLPLEGGGEAGLGQLICYEAIFPEVSRGLVRDGADLLVNTSNDAWYGASSAPHQFLRIVTLRAVENGRFLVRAANTGVSAVVDPAGVILQQTRLGLAADEGDRIEAAGKLPPDHLVAEVPLLSIRTPYLVTGDLFAWLCVLGTLVGLGRAAAQARRGRTGRGVL